MSSDAEKFDAIVLGGGPAGSTVSTFLAMQGHRVLLLERERFPRHQLGESLLPSTVHGICRLLGLRDELARAGFPRKLGGTFRWGKDPEPWTFHFSIAPNSPTGFAYQVERAKFDKILLDNAARNGVDVREQHEVLDAISEGGRVVGVRFRDAEGRERSAYGRYVIEAQGHRGSLYKLAGQREFSKFFQNVALYGYFEGGKRLPPPNSGNILSAAFKDGWFWYIPLSDTLTSVGAVVAKEKATIIQQGPEAALSAFIDACPIIKEYLAPATRVRDGMYGELRVRKDYSYANTKFWTPGLVLIGDAACFIDPVFSSGVHLATYSALLAARSVNTLLRGELDEEACFTEFERRYRREFGVFYEFLLTFYDMNQDADSYFWSARKILHSEERSNRPFVRLIAGVSSEGEPLFGEGDDFFSEQNDVASWFESNISRSVIKAQSAGGPANGGRRPEAAFFDRSGFMERFTGESIQVQVQAQFGAKRPQEKPIFPGGLVPTADGFGWRLPG
jgi:FAD-dependent halogenase